MELKQEMRRAQGIGLAAPQVGRHQQLLVMRQDPRAAGSTTLIVANPKIVQQRGLQRNHEGCLSVPTGRVWVERPQEIVVEFLDERGKHRSLLLKGLAAACLQHEMDHLAGVLIPDYLAQFSQHE